MIGLLIAIFVTQLILLVLILSVYSALHDHIGGLEFQQRLNMRGLVRLMTHCECARRRQLRQQERQRHGDQPG